MNELKHAFRQVIMRPGLSVIVIVMLALGIGVLIGLGAKAMLYGLSNYDPLVLGAAVVVLMGVVLAAGYFPARRASIIAPMEALRHE